MRAGQRAQVINYAGERPAELAINADFYQLHGVATVRRSGRGDRISAHNLVRRSLRVGRWIRETGKITRESAPIITLYQTKNNVAGDFGVRVDAVKSIVIIDVEVLAVGSGVKKNSSLQCVTEVFAFFIFFFTIGIVTGFIPQSDTYGHNFLIALWSPLLDYI